jgi:putative transcriptional regulator
MKNYVKDLRLERNLTQQELADALNISRQMISYIEKGIKRPNIILALKIGDFFEVPIEQIFELDKAD